MTTSNSAPLPSADQPELPPEDAYNDFDSIVDESAGTVSSVGNESKQVKKRNRRVLAGTVLASTLALGAATAIDTHLDGDSLDLKVAAQAPQHYFVSDNSSSYPHLPIPKYPDAKQLISSLADPKMPVGGDYPSLNGEVVKETSEYDTRCLSVDVSLPETVSRDLLNRGAHTEFAISTSQAKRLRNTIETATDLKTVQSALTELMQLSGGYSIEFDGEHPSTQGPIKPVRLIDYKESATSFVDAFAVLPKDLMNIYKSGKIFAQRKQIYNDIEKENTVGLYDYQDFSIVVEMGYISEARLVTHELMHSFYDVVCEGIFNDAGLSDIYQEVSKDIVDNPKYIALINSLYDGSMNHEEYAELNNMIAQSGAPSIYSLTNSTEYAAEIMAYITDPAASTFTPEQKEILESNVYYKQALERVLEELQSAMPNVDVPAWFAYVKTFSGASSPAYLEPTTVISKGIVDGNIPSELTPEDTLEPAIQFASGEVLYAVDNGQILQLNIPESLLNDPYIC